METNTSPNHIIDNPNLPPLTPTLPDQEREVTYHSDVGYATSVDLGMLTELEEGAPTYPSPQPPSPCPDQPTIHCRVMNLSSTKLTEDEYCILEFGLKFIPSPNFHKKNSRTCLRMAANSLVRHLYITYFFHHKKKTKSGGQPLIEDQLSYCANSAWNPPRDFIPAPPRWMDDLIICLPPLPPRTSQG